MNIFKFLKQLDRHQSSSIVLCRHKNLLLSLSASALGIFIASPSIALPSNYNDPSNYPAAWPTNWVPYTAGGGNIEDKIGSVDGSNGGATPNPAIIDIAGGPGIPSVYFYRDTSNLYVRFRLEATPIKTTGVSQPFDSATWTVLLDVDGDGFKEFAIQVSGSDSGGQPDDIIVFYDNSNSQALDLSSNVLWRQDSAVGGNNTVDGEANSSSTWDVNSDASIYDFRRTRVSPDGAGKYFLDIQVPLAALDASSKGGPTLTASSSFALAYSTAASNTDPAQKDFAFSGDYVSAINKPLPFGDVVSPDGTTSSKPSIKSITGGTCGANSSISAEVIDSLKLQNGSLVSSISQVQFLYYADLNGNGIADDGQSWVSIGNGTLASNTTNPWTITWNTTNLTKGKYLLKAVATDDQNNIVDSAQTITSNAQYNVATNGTTPIVYSLDNTTCGVSKDYGDAPDSYGTNSTDNNGEGVGANHIIVNTLKLGATAPDSETDAQTPLDGTGDGADEDGISTFPSLDTSTSSYSLTATVNNTTGSAANVYSWIDFDHDGKFDGDERATVSNGSIILSSGKVPNNSNGTVTLTWNNLGGTGANIINSNSYARIRLTTDNLTAATATTTRDLASVGNATNGEVEDYPIAIAKSYDYGDAPTLYGDASHEIFTTPTVYLGSVKPDKESGTQLGTDSGAAAAGDDNNGDDEDAFTALANVPTVGNYNLTVPVHNTSVDNATLHAWIDFNKNGQFELGEYKSAAVANNSTSASLNWTVPTGTLPGSTHVRFRLTTDNTLTDNSGTNNVDERSIGNVSNGEVEDYPVSISIPIYDYGDAPDTNTGTGTGNYQTTASDGGAAQVVIDAVGQVLSLGSNIDTDDGNLQSPTADADDTTSTTSIDDEDGVSSFPTLTTTANQTYTVPVSVRNNVPLLNAFLVGYIDFNKDGDFNDTGEKSATVTVPTDSSNPRTLNVTFTTPTGVTAGNTYARFRLGSVQATAESATGASVSTDNGEVEDYQIAIAPDGNRPLGSPFSCDSTFYITIGAGSGAAQDLYSVNRSGSNYTFNPPIGPSTSTASGYPNTFSYNALAYNPANNYLYGIVTNSSATSGPYAAGNVVQIGSDGILHSIGKPTNGSGGTLAITGYVAATMLADGTYVIGQSGNIAKLNVNTSPPTILSTGSLSGVSFTDFAVDPKDPTSLSGGRIYGIDETSDRLVILNVAGNNPTIISQATNPTGFNHNTGSQFVDSFGTLYYRSNTDNNLYRVDSDSTSPNYGRATLITNAPSGGNHDGASCLFSSVMQKDVQDLNGNKITTSPAGEVVKYVYSIASGNVQNLTGVTFQDDLRTVSSGNPINGTFNGNYTVSNGSGTVSFSNNNQTIQISNLVIPAQTQATIGADKLTITAEVNVSKTLTPGEYFNQASITNLPATYPASIASDYPTSPAYEDPTPLQVTAPIPSDPNLLLVKRITAINPGQSDEIQFNNFVNDGPSTDDEAANWPDSDSNPSNNINDYLRGAISVPQIKPGDEVEYTIYFLSNGDVAANNVEICDVVPDNMTFNKNSYGTEVGMSLALNATTLPTIPNTNLSNLIDTDEGSFYAPGTNPPIVDLCKKHDPNNPNSLIPVNSSNNLSGAVLINLSNPLPAATSPGVPTNSYGFIRFRAKVK